MRTAAILIDNFLDDEKWNYIQNEIKKTNYLIVREFTEERTELYLKIIRWIKEKLKSVDIWNEHWDNTIDMWSYINSLPPEVDRESSGGGYHTDFGGFVYYIHPSWDPNWGGHLKFKECNVEKIEPSPNRFVWINPAVWHGIEIVNSSASHNRITVVGWPEGCVEYPDANQIINTTTGV